MIKMLGCCENIININFKMSNESVNNKFVNVTNGYGQLCEVGARATLGATVEVYVDAQVKSLRESDI
jgi:hypothetical protein